MYVLHMHTVLARPKEGTEYSESGVTNGCELPHECQEPGMPSVRGAIS